MAANSPIASAVNQAINQGIAGGSAASAPLLTDLVAYWDLSEASGTRNDSHTNGYHLTDNNTVGQRTGVGATGTAADFVAANSEYLNSAGSIMPVAPFSMVLWVLLNADPPTGVSFLDCYHNTIATGGFRLTSGTNGRVVFSWSNGSTTANAGNSATEDTTGAAWHFFYIEHDGTRGLVNMDDGTDKTATLGYAQTTDPLDFGRYDISTDTFIDGGIQAAGLYSRALTAAERTWFYNTASAARLYADVEAYTG